MHLSYRKQVSAVTELAAALTAAVHCSLWERRTHPQLSPPPFTAGATNAPASQSHRPVAFRDACLSHRSSRAAHRPLQCQCCVLSETCRRSGDVSRGLTAAEVAVVELFLPCCIDAKWQPHRKEGRKEGSDVGAQTLIRTWSSREIAFFGRIRDRGT
jgi:hypothetical protein